MAQNAGQRQSGGANAPGRSIWAHPGRNVGAITGCAVTCISTTGGFVWLDPMASPTQLLYALVIILPIAIVFGWIVVDLTVIRSQSRAEARLDLMRRQLRRYADLASRDLFDRVIDTTDDELGHLSREIHRALTTAHRDRLENARIRRDLDDRVSKETRRRTAELTRMSRTDALTGLANRRAFDEQFGSLVDTCLVAGEGVSCVSIDLDRFKETNDVLGHAVGDKVLEAMGQVLGAIVRKTDLAARTGGDEFVLVLPGCDHASAEALCRRLELLFDQHPDVKGLGARRPGVSWGVASVNGEQDTTPDVLLQRSDEAMYARKQARKAQRLAR
jgi:diguanylate cyclase (GGDEF)-like protein